MKKHAFTMAEAILVMTILGIIATIMITTLKPADFQDKGLKVLAQKVLNNIDNATTQLLMNNSADGTFDNVYPHNSTTAFATSTNTDDNATALRTLYQGYVATTRKSCTNTTDCGECGDTTKYKAGFYMKDGSCMAFGLGAASRDTIFPGETGGVKTLTDQQATRGVIFFDINGLEGPNVAGKDQFLVPFGKDGIDYTTAPANEQQNQQEPEPEP